MKNDYSFYYKIYAVDKGIVSEYSTKPDTGYYELVYDPTVSVEIVENKIFDYELMQNYPNPFNPITTIDYSIKEEGDVELVIYDVLGKVVEKIVDERKTPGNYSVQFDASKLSSGIYFHSLRVNEFVSNKKDVALK
ncbi:MAG: T9SS type A sorting domain-containing protein [Ignavibacteriaceae bacterium]|nr:T9SS type A sorting domain-containing protein [Ignavibacteriaceae bacterium]